MHDRRLPIPAGPVPVLPPVSPTPQTPAPPQDLSPALASPETTELRHHSRVAERAASAIEPPFSVLNASGGIRLILFVTVRVVPKRALMAHSCVILCQNSVVCCGRRRTVVDRVLSLFFWRENSTQYRNGQG